MSRRELRRHAGRLAIVGFAGHDVPGDLRRLAAEFDLGGVIYFARNVAEPRQVAELSRQVAASAARLAALDQRRSGRRPGCAAEVAVHRVAAGDDARPQRRRTTRRALRRRAGRRAAGRRHQPRLRARPRRAHQSDKSGHRRPRARRAAPRTWRGSARRCCAGSQGAGVAGCGKHFPGHGDTSTRLPRRAADRRARTAVGSRPSSSCRSSRAIAAERGDDDDRARAGAGARRRPARRRCRRRSCTDLLKGKLGFEGVVFSDDLGMKAVSATCPLPDATVDALVGGLRRRAAVQLDGRRTGRRASKRIIHAARVRRSSPRRASTTRSRASGASKSSSSAAVRAASVPLDVVGLRASTRRSPRRWPRGGDAAHPGRTHQVPARPSPAAASPSSLPPAHSTGRNSSKASPS